MDKRILILGASPLQVPIIKKSKHLGYYTGVIDYNRDAGGIKYADEFYNISTNDTQAIEKVVQSFKPDGITTIGTDMPIRVIASIGEKYGLPSVDIETAFRCTDKAEMMSVLKRDNVPIPSYFFCKGEKQAEMLRFKIKFPVVIKPTDNSGSRGVIIVNTKEDYMEAVKYSLSYSKENEIVVTEYLEGPEVSVEVLLVRGEPHILAVTDKVTTGAPYFVELQHTQPSILDEKILLKIKEITKRAIKSLGINFGPVHAELIVTRDGPKVIEVGARMGGAFIASHLVENSTGTDFMKLVLQQSVGENFQITTNRTSFSSVITIIPEKKGIITKISGLEDLKAIQGVDDIFLLKSVGDAITDLKNGSDRVALVVIKGSSIKELEMISKNIQEKLLFDIS